MTITLDVNKITVVRDQSGPDHVYLNTTLPSGTWPFNRVQDLEITVAHQLGMEYCKKHFPGIPVELIAV